MKRLLLLLFLVGGLCCTMAVLGDEKDSKKEALKEYAGWRAKILRGYVETVKKGFPAFDYYLMSKRVLLEMDHIKNNPKAVRGVQGAIERIKKEVKEHKDCVRQIESKIKQLQAGKIPPLRKIKLGGFLATDRVFPKKLRGIAVAEWNTNASKLARSKRIVKGWKRSNGHMGFLAQPRCDRKVDIYANKIVCVSSAARTEFEKMTNQFVTVDALIIKEGKIPGGYERWLFVYGCSRKTTDSSSLPKPLKVLRDARDIVPDPENVLSRPDVPIEDQLKWVELWRGLPFTCSGITIITSADEFKKYQKFLPGLSLKVDFSKEIVIGTAQNPALQNQRGSGRFVRIPGVYLCDAKLLVFVNTAEYGDRTGGRDLQNLAYHFVVVKRVAVKQVEVVSNWCALSIEKSIKAGAPNAGKCAPPRPKEHKAIDVQHLDDAALRARVDILLKKMASEKYKERSQASIDLRNLFLGAGAKRKILLEQLMRRSKEIKDPEVQVRMESFLRPWKHLEKKWTLMAHLGAMTSLSLSPDSKLLASAGADGRIHVWDAQTGRCLRTMSEHTDRVLLVTFSPDGKMLLSSGDDKTLRIWDPKTGKCLRTLKGCDAATTSACFSPDGSLIAASTADGTKTVVIWDTKTGKCLHTLKEAGTRVHFSPDGRFLVATEYEGSVWDAKSGKCLYRSKMARRTVFSPDGKILATSRQDEIRLRDPGTGKVIRELWHKAAVTCLAFSPDGKLIAAGDYGCNLRVWDTATGKSVHVFEKLGGSISSVAFGPGGEWFVTAAPREVNIRDTRSGKSLRKFPGAGGFVISPAGDTMILFTRGVVSVWGIRER